MSFTTPCFIRKNTPELRAKLEDIGYIKMLVWTRETDTCLKTSPMLEVVGTNDYAPQYYTFSSLQSKPDSLIDCGTNEPLFLAIAGRRDDSDKDQYFFIEIVENYCDGCLIYSSQLFICTENKIDDYLDKIPIDYREVWKATIPELIEYFKTE